MSGNNLDLSIYIIYFSQKNGVERKQKHTNYRQEYQK